MKYVMSALAAIALFALSMNANANSEADLLDLVHKNGFVGCDSAIKQNFKQYLADDGVNGYVDVNYFEETRNTFSITATWGNVGDSVMQNTVFEKHGAVCYSYGSSQISTKLSCNAYKESESAWKYVDSSGDYLWTTNSGGVHALMKTLPFGGCFISFHLFKKYPAD